MYLVLERIIFVDFEVRSSRLEHQMYTSDFERETHLLKFSNSIGLECKEV